MPSPSAFTIALTGKVYAWRHGVPGGKSPILRISQRVLEDYPAFIVVHHLDELKVARAIRARPETRLLVVQNGLTVILDEPSWIASGLTARD